MYRIKLKDSIFLNEFGIKIVGCRIINVDFYI